MDPGSRRGSGDQRHHRPSPLHRRRPRPTGKRVSLFFPPRRGQRFHFSRGLCAGFRMGRRLGGPRGPRWTALPPSRLKHRSFRSIFSLKKNRTSSVAECRQKDALCNGTTHRRLTTKRGPWSRNRLREKEIWVFRFEIATHPTLSARDLRFDMGRISAHGSWKRRHFS